MCQHSNVAYVRISVFVLFAVVLFVGGATGQYVGDSCSLNGQVRNGVCMLIPDCPSVQEALRRGQLPIRCGFQGTVPIVCCPSSTTTTRRPTATTRRRGTTRTTTPIPTTTPITTPRPTTTPRITVPDVNSAGGSDPIAIARRKCQEYSRWVYALEVSPVNLPGRVTEKENLCAVDSTPLIVGGEKTKDAEFPHMLAVGYGSEANPEWLCGGSLISENFALTAAHCTFGQRGEAKWVQVGSLVLSTSITRNFGANGRILQVVQRIRHPNYKVPARYNDIALLKLAPLPGDETVLIPSQPIPDGDLHPLFNKFIRPACLQSETRLPYAKAIATGWGRIGYGADTSPELLKVQLSVIDAVTCNESYTVEATTSKLSMGIIPSQVCAGELEGGKDTCQGDSGGPLQYVLQDIYCMYSLIGVTSFGKFCGFRNSPAVYSRVSEYLPWIVQNVWPQG